MLRVVLLPTIVLASSCKGILVSDDCWVLSQPAQSCADLCGGASRVDAETTVGGATTRMVVSALEAKYGLHDTSKDSLDAPCGWPPYLAEGEVQFPEWGMVSLPPHTAHRTRHTCPAHIRAEVHRATPGSTCSSPTRTSMARAVGTASKVRPTAESRPACAALVSATRRLQAHHRPHHRTRRRRHRLLLLRRRPRLPRHPHPIHRRRRHPCPTHNRRRRPGRGIRNRRHPRRRHRHHRHRHRHRAMACRRSAHAGSSARWARGAPQRAAVRSSPTRRSPSRSARQVS